jgi:O-antigen ligase
VTTAAHGARRSFAGDSPGLASVTRVSGSVSYVLLVTLLIEALFEAWLILLLAGSAIGGAVDVEALVRALRNGGYIALGLTSFAHVLSKGELHRFLRPVDLAFALLAVVLIVVGLVGGSSLTLIGHGVFVYLRGAVLFYALRALAPDWSRVRPVLWLVGGIVVVNVFIAVLQGWLGPPAYSALGFTDLTWANANRAQGLFSHPNHLGHVTGLAMLGVLAWNLPRMRLRWWALFAVFALGMALAQSRESSVAVLAAIVALAFLQSGNLRKIAVAIGLTLALTGVVWTIQPGSWQALSEKAGGVVSAVQVPSGAEAGVGCDPAVQDCTATGLPRRATRVLYYQQGLRLWLQSPLLGYGVGQFGGGVASQNNPDWHENPRFGPEGFNLHGFDATQVDSFWLHLAVETGVVGTSAYVLWIGLLGLPALRRAWRGGQSSADDAVGWVHPAYRWAPPAILFGCLVAGFSPALENPLFPPMLFGIIGLAWVLDRGPAHHGPSNLAAPTPSPP